METHYVIKANSIKGTVYLKSGLKRWTLDVFKAGVFSKEEAHTHIKRTRTTFQELLQYFEIRDANAERTATLSQ